VHGGKGNGAHDCHEMSEPENFTIFISMISVVTLSAIEQEADLTD
jgi:hypothetical protein